MAKVPEPRQRNVAASCVPPLRVVLLTALAALATTHVDAMRLDGTAMGEAQGKPSRHKAAKIAKEAGGDQVTPESHREHELRLAYAYVQNVQVTDNLKLSAMKDTIDRLERLRQVASGSGPFRESEKRKMVRVVLRDIRVKTDALKLLVAMKEAAGEVDDGGNVLPSKRPNICNAEYIEADDDFVAEIYAICDALDAVRKAFAARRFEAAAISEIVGRMTSIKTKGWYANPSISLGISEVLNEEKRWVAKKIAARAARGEHCERIAKLLDMWMGEDGIVNPESHAPAASENALWEAYEVAMGTIVNNSTSWKALRTGHERLQLYKNHLESLLPVSGPRLSDRVHVLLKMYKVKLVLIRVYALERESEGDVDDGGDVPPTRRVNVCSKIAEYKVTEEIKAEINKICANLDRMREVLLSGGDPRAEMLDVVERVNALMALRDYADMPVAGELDFVLAEERCWMKKHDDKSSVWIRTIGDFARRVVALFAVGPRVVSNFLLKQVREKIPILRQLAQPRAAPGASPNAIADGVDDADVTMQAPGTPAALAEASADGADGADNALH